MPSERSFTKYIYIYFPPALPFGTIIAWARRGRRESESPGWGCRIVNIFSLYDTRSIVGKMFTIVCINYSEHLTYYSTIYYNREYYPYSGVARWIYYSINILTCQYTLELINTIVNCTIILIIYSLRIAHFRTIISHYSTH